VWLRTARSIIERKLLKVLSTIWTEAATTVTLYYRLSLAVFEPRNPAYANPMDPHDRGSAIHN